MKKIIIEVKDEGTELNFFSGEEAVQPTDPEIHPEAGGTSTCYRNT